MRVECGVEHRTRPRAWQSICFGPISKTALHSLASQIEQEQQCQLVTEMLPPLNRNND